MRRDASLQKLGSTNLTITGATSPSQTCYLALSRINPLVNGSTSAQISWNRKGSGEPAEVKIAHVWTLDGRKVTRFQHHVDTAKERYLIAGIVIGHAPT